MLPKITHKKTVAAIGKFDSFHIGHAKLIRTACKIAKEKDLLSLILFIGSHSPDIISEEESASVVKSFDIDLALRQELDEKFKSLSAENFVKDVLSSKLNCECVVVGDNFRFSKNRSADANKLKRLCEKNDIECIIIEEVRLENSLSEICTVSSTYIRELISKGMMEDVCRFLGRPFTVTSIVTEGKRIGSYLGIPTANLVPQKGKQLPPDGVYASRTMVDGKIYLSITNVGTNPTVGDGNAKTIETNILDFDRDIYGKTITVEFMERIRGEKRFDSLDILKKQIEKDIDYVKNRY